MRALLCIFCLFPALHAQTAPQPAGAGIPAALRDYLSLTAPQLSQIAAINETSAAQIGAKDQEVANLRQKLDTELQKVVMDVAIIGPLAVSLELSRRSAGVARAQLTSSLLNVLNADQRRKVQTLQDAHNLATLINAAISANLIEGSGDIQPAPPAGKFRKLPERLPSIPRDR